MKQVSEKNVTALKYLTTMAACLVYVFEGIVFTVPEPTLIQLRDVAGTTIAGVSLIFSVRSIGALIGALVTGFLVKNWRRDVMLGILTIVMSLALGIVPWCSNLWSMLCAFFVQGISVGYVETNCNVLLKDIWLKESAPALQAICLCFFIGCFLAPLMGIPFLGNAIEERQLTFPRSSVESHHHGHLDKEVVDSLPSNESCCREMFANTTDDYPMRLTSLKQYYVLSTFVGVMCGVFMLVFGVLGERYVLRGNDVQDDDPKTNKQQRPLDMVAVLSLITISGGLFVGTDLNYGGFLPAFVVEQLNGTEAQGNYMTSMFWGVYMMATAVGVIVAKYVRASKIIFICSLIMTVSLVVLAVGGHITWVAWVGTAMFAVGCSSIYGSIFVLADEYVTLTPVVSAVVVSGMTVGEFIVPLVSGQLFESNPMSLMYLTLTCIVISDIGFIMIEIIICNFGTRRYDYDNLD